MEPSERVYVWAPRSEVVYLQAVIDAYEGLARVRTERHEGDRSLLLLLSPPSRKAELHDFLRHIKEELNGPLEILD